MLTPVPEIDELLPLGLEYCELSGCGGCTPTPAPPPPTVTVYTSPPVKFIELSADDHRPEVLP